MKLRRSRPWAVAVATVVLLYLTGPGFDLWPLAFIALSPLIGWARTSPQSGRLAVYVSFFAYYLVSLQGLRYAHPLMVFPLLALAAYLAIYPLLFVVLLRRWSGIGDPRPGVDATKPRPEIWGTEIWATWRARVPTSLVAAVLWVGGEWVRNYFATGISVLMLGHSLAGMSTPTIIQMVDLFGTYGVSFVLVLTSVAAADGWRWCVQRRAAIPGSHPANRWVGLCASWQTSLPIALVAVVAAHFYGVVTLAYPTRDSGATWMLIGRDEQTEYQQDLSREQEIFSEFARQSISAVSRSATPVDVVVWPESMLSGGQPWYIAEEDLAVPAELAGEGQGPSLSVAQMRRIITQSQDDFTRRNQDLQAAMSSGTPFPPPAIIGGCGVVRYGAGAKQYSGVVLVDPDGHVRETYAKNHLVMFGEYIPLIKSIPWLKDFVPPGLGLDAGVGPTVFEVGKLRALPNLCIESAVERIAVNHMRTLWKRDPSSLPQVIVTLTNDAWFDNSAVVQHHLRCAQMVAIACRRPILSAANGGPTAWIDSSGAIVEQLPAGEAGEIVATPKLDDRVSTYVRLGAWPAGVMGVLWIVGLISCLSQGIHNWHRRRLDRRRNASGNADEQ